MQAIQATGTQGVPTVVIVTSRSTPASQALRNLLAQAPEAAAIARTARFAEMPAEIYAKQVKTLGITTFPTVIVYNRGKTGVEAVAVRNSFADQRQIFAWLGSLNLGVRTAAAQASTAPVPAGAPATAPAPAPATAPAPAPATATAPATAPSDASVVETMYQHPSGQAYPTEQQPAPPPPPPPPPPPAPYCPPPVQQPVYAPQPQQYVPAPAPYYVQTQTPAMVLQQAPQQIVLAPPPPPQITVAMAPSPVYAPAPMSAPPNLFTQPAPAPPMQPAPAPPMQPAPAPPMQPAPAPAMQPMQAPQYAPAPAPAPTAMVLQAPGLVNSMIGTFGEYLARRRNPRIQMSPMPTLAQAPVANAPVALAPAYGQAPGAYAQVTAYAPAGPPMAIMTPESTSFAPCNTYRAPCRFHGGPCPGPGGGYSPPPPPYPAPSAQDGSNSGRGWFDWMHKR